ncbi:MAG: helix-turn-helix domain-containing protein [Microcoleaceae cyanobacterium]
MMWSSQLDAILAHIQDAQELHSIVQNSTTDRRLLNFLIWLDQKFGHPIETGIFINLRLTHLEIADAVGTTRVSVTRTQAAFRTSRSDFTSSSSLYYFESLI